MRRRTAAAWGLVLASLAAGCGVPTRGSADRAKAADVPFGLLEEQRSTDGASATGTQVVLYYYEPATSRLVPSGTRVDDTSVEAILRQLQEVPDEGQALAAGNPLGDTDVIQAVELKRGLVTVDLATNFTDLSNSGQLAALAEIVYTATARPGVGQVTFTIDGEPTEVPRGDGSLTSEPVTRLDYAELAPVSE